jgi:non-specific serine/threonine protein kinase
MSVPDPRRLPPEDQLTQYEAVRLFIDRAVAAVPSFAVTNENAPSVAQVCFRLDGIPLAIELAAARVRMMPANQIAARLDDQFRLLTGGSRTALPRQQTLRATVDWSYDLLGESERALLRRLSVFAGGWSLEAAEVVCAGGEVGAYDILDLLTQLVNKSLVQVEESGTEARHRMLETIRQYAAEKLAAAGEADGLRLRHLEFFLRLAEEAEPELHGTEQLAWLARLHQEQDNLRAALGWSLGGDRPELGLRLAAALGWFWCLHDDLSEGRSWAARALRLSGPHGAGLLETDGLKRARASALQNVVWLHFLQGDFDAARAYIDESLPLWRELGDRRGEGLSLNMAGMVAAIGGDFGAAARLIDESLALVRGTGDRWALALALRGRGVAAAGAGDDAQVVAAYEESLEHARAVGDRWLMTPAFNRLGEVAHHGGDYPRARRLYEQGLALARELGNRVGIAWSLEHLGELALDEGDHARALALFLEPISMWRDASSVSPQGASALEHLASVAVAFGELERAARLIAAARNLAGGVDDRYLSVDAGRTERDLAALRSRLGPAAFEEAWAEGAAMTLDEALAEAREFAGTFQPDEEQLVAAPAPPDVSRPDANPNGLTDREVEVLRLLSRGLTSAQIGEALVISAVTVNTHLRNIYGKLGVNTRGAAIRWAVDRGIV